MGTEAPSPRFSVHAGAPVLHILKAAVSPVIAKPVQGNHVKFSYARNVSCYKLVIHHSRGDGTARSTPSVASTRTVRRSGEHRSGSTVRRVRALLRQGRIGKGLCCKPKKSPARSSVLTADKSFPPLGKNVFGTVPFPWRRTRALHRSGTGTLYPEHGSGIKELSHGNTSYSQRS